MQIKQYAAHLTKLWVAKTSQEEPYPIWPMTFPFWNDSIVDLPNVLLMNPRFWVVQHCTKFCWLSQFLLLVNSQFLMEKVTTSWWNVPAQDRPALKDGRWHISLYFGLRFQRFVGSVSWDVDGCWEFSMVHWYWYILVCNGLYDEKNGTISLPSNDSPGFGCLSLGDEITSGSNLIRIWCTSLSLPFGRIFHAIQSQTGQWRIWKSQHLPSGKLI